MELIRDTDLALKNVARRLRNECVTKMRRAKCDFVKNEMNTNTNVSKKIWRNVKEIWPNKKANSPKITLIDQDTKNEIRQEDTANYINQFFTNVGPSLARNLTEPWSYDGIISQRHINNIEVNNVEILKICHDIDTNKGSSIKNISSKALKDSLIWQIDCFC